MARPPVTVSSDAAVSELANLFADRTVDASRSSIRAASWSECCRMSTPCGRSPERRALAPGPLIQHTRAGPRAVATLAGEPLRNDFAPSPSTTMGPSPRWSALACRPGGRARGSRRLAEAPARDGRILSELRAEFPEVDRHFDAIVAENGAVLARPGPIVRRLADLIPQTSRAITSACANCRASWWWVGARGCLRRATWRSCCGTASARSWSTSRSRTTQESAPARAPPSPSSSAGVARPDCRTGNCSRRYSHALLSRDHRFYFRNDRGLTGLVAGNLAEFTTQLRCA